MQKTRKIPVFYTVILALALLAALIVGVILNVLWDFLSSYETYLPQYVAERLYEELFHSNHFRELYQVAKPELGAFEGENQFDTYMSRLTSGKELQCYEITTGKPDQMKYRVSVTELREDKVAEKKLGDIFLKKSEEKASWGQTVWVLDRIELAEPETREVKVKVITGSTLQLNGVAVPRSYIVEAGIETESCKHMPEGVKGMTYDIYSVSGLLADPSITCINQEGGSSQTYYDKQSEQYVESISYDATFSQMYAQQAIDSLQTYQRYLTNDAYRSDVKKYLDEDSEFYKKLMRTDTQWYAPHIAHEYADEAVAEFYRYSDEVFSCRYVGTQIITRTKKDIRYFDLDCILYFHMVDGEYQVYDIVFQ